MRGTPSAPGPEPASPRSLWVRAGWVFLAALALRLLHVWALERTPLGQLLLGDASAYDAWARRIAAGDWLGSEVFYQAPLYPYLLGAWYALVGPGLLLLRVLQAVLGAAACAVLAVAAGSLLGARAGTASGFLLAFYAPAIFFDALVQKAVLDLLLISLLLLAVARLTESVTRSRALAAGVVLGLLALSRENAIVLLPVLLVWLWLRARRAVVPVLLLAAGVAAVLGPVAIRNRALGGELLPTTSQLGPNLYIGNHEGATGGYVPLRHGRGSAEFERRDATEIAERNLARRLRPAEVSSYWRDRALEWIRGHPGAWLRLLGKKILLVWNAREAMDTEDLATHGEWSPTLRWSATLLHFGVLAPLALLGIWWTRSRWRDLGVLYAAIAVYSGSVALFFVLARYRYPLVPLLVPFAGAALVELPGKLRRSPGQDWLLAGAILALAALVGNWPLLSRDTQRAGTHFNLGRALEKEGRLEAALVEYRRAVELHPGYASARLNLGVVLAARGQHDAAFGQFLEAVRLDPDSAPASANLGVEYAKRGRNGDAIRSLERAAALDPDTPNVQFNLATALAAAGRPDEAASRFREALRLDPDNADAHNNLGILLASSGRLGEATLHFESAVRLRPDFQAAAANLARAREMASAGATGDPLGPER